MLRTEAVDTRQGSPEGEQVITSQGIIARASQVLSSSEMDTTVRHLEQVNTSGKYMIDESQTTFHGFPAVIFRAHWRTGEKSPNDLGIFQEWQLFGQTPEGRISLELTTFEEREPSISIVNQDTKTRVYLDEVSRSEQGEIARVMKISS